MRNLLPAPKAIDFNRLIRNSFSPFNKMNICLEIVISYFRKSKKFQFYTPKFD